MWHTFPDHKIYMKRVNQVAMHFFTHAMHAVHDSVLSFTFTVFIIFD